MGRELNNDDTARRTRLVFDVDAGLHEEILATAKHNGQRVREFCIQAIRARLNGDGLGVVGDDPIRAEIEREAARRHQSEQDYIVEALKAYLTPSLRFSTPDRHDPSSLRDFLAEAQEIEWSGLTLSMISRDSIKSILLGKIADRVPMRFVTLDPSIVNTSKYEYLTRRFGKAYLATIGETLERTHSTLRELAAASEEAGSNLQVLVTEIIPSCGLIIINPYTDNLKVRVTLYLEIVPEERHPVFEIQGNTREGELAARPFIRHFDWITTPERSRHPEGVSPT